MTRKQAVPNKAIIDFRGMAFHTTVYRKVRKMARNSKTAENHGYVTRNFRNLFTEVLNS